MEAKDNPELISVGQIINTQGHRGEVRVWPLTDNPKRFQANDVFVAELNQKTFNLTVDSVRNQKNFLVIKFREIEDMNAAEKMKNALLKIPKDQLIDLPEDTFFIFEIIGMDVYTDEGFYLGKVKDVTQTGSNDLYTVKGESKEYLIPAVKNIVREISREEKKITITPVEGLLEL